MTNSPQPVFVIGHARSGTSIMCILLRKYLNIAYGPESQFIIRIYKNIHLFGNLSDEHNMRQLIRQLAKERCFARWKKKFAFQYDEEKIYRGIREKSYAGVLDSIFRQLTDHLGKEQWGDKTPEYNQYLPELLTIFPQARFIHMVRDGRDVVLSAMQKHFGAQNIVIGARYWCASLKNIQHFKQLVAKESLLEIRYENLMDQPVVEFTRIIHFLQIADASGQLQAILDEQLAQELKPANTEKWRTKLTAQENELFERVGGHYLKIYNFARLHDELPPLTPIELLYWQTQNLIKRFLIWKSWKDNFYRSWLRLRSYSLHMKAVFNKVASKK